MKTPTAMKAQAKVLTCQLTAVSVTLCVGLSVEYVTCQMMSSLQGMTGALWDAPYCHM